MTRAEQEHIETMRKEKGIKEREVLILSDYIDTLGKYSKYTPETLLRLTVHPGERFVKGSEILSTFQNINAHLQLLLNADYKLARKALKELTKGAYKRDAVEARQLRILNEIKKEIVIADSEKKGTKKIAQELNEVEDFWKDLVQEKKNLFGQLKARKNKFFKEPVAWPFESIRKQDFELLKRIDKVIHLEEEVIQRRKSQGLVLKKAA